MSEIADGMEQSLDINRLVGMSYATYFMRSASRSINEGIHPGSLLVVSTAAPPGQRHRGDDGMILIQRDKVYQAAREAHPERWSGETRNWQPIITVTLNPEREKQAA